MKRSGPIARRTPMPAVTEPLERHKPLPRGKALRRAAVIHSRQLARSVRPLVGKAKTRVGEFPARTRKVLYARWDGRCAWCGDWMHPKAFTCQHRRARGAGGSTDPLTVSPANGVAIHQVPCHDYIEAHPAEALATGYRVAQRGDPRTVPVLLWTGRRVYLTDDGGAVAAEPEERA